MNSASPLAKPIPAVLTGGASRSSLLQRLGLSDSSWRLVLLVGMPYWVAVGAVNIVAALLFASASTRIFNPSALGLTPGVRVLQYVLMLIVVLAAYRTALHIGWPAERRWSAAAKHLALGLGVALVSRPIFVVAMDLLLDVHVDWFGVFVPPSNGIKLWTSMALDFLLRYFLGLALIAGVHTSIALQRSELERANLRSAWMQARLQAMRMQLNPHFLFNTFNTIATLLDTQPQPARARALVLALSDLYRRTLAAAERDWTSLSEELAFASDYLRIQAARFEGRLTYEVECAAGLGAEHVPALLLQPLVENAVAHGTADDRQSLHVSVRVECDTSASGEREMRIEVVNTTDGALGSAPGAGVGLRNTRTRLAACYGGRARLDAMSTGRGRFVARAIIPRATEVAANASPRGVA